MHPMIRATSELTRRAAASVDEEGVKAAEAARGVCGQHFWFLTAKVARQLSANKNGSNSAPSPAPLNKYR